MCVAKNLLYIKILLQLIIMFKQMDGKKVRGVMSKYSLFGFKKNLFVQFLIQLYLSVKNLLIIMFA